MRIKYILENGKTIELTEEETKELASNLRVESIAKKIEKCYGAPECSECIKIAKIAEENIDDELALNEIFGKYLLYTNKYKGISYSVRNAIWAFSYNTNDTDINNKSFVIYYSVEGLTIEVSKDSKDDIEDILDLLINKMVSKE